MKRKLIVGITAEGSVNLIRGQLRYFKDQGYDTYLMSPFSERSKAYCEEEGCKHLVLPIEREISLLSDFINLIRVISIFLSVKPDVINFGTPKVSLLGMIAGYLTGVKRRIYTCRGFRFEHETGFKRKVLVLMEKVTSRFAHRVICISPSVKEFGVENNIFSKSKAIVINKGSSNGLDLELFNRNSIDEQSKKDLKRTLGLENKFVFGFVGRVVDRKGISELYEAFTKLYENNSNIALVIVGPVEKDQLKNRELKDKLDLHEAIFMLGKKNQNEVPLYLSIQDAFVLPAWWEGFGNVLIQAAAMGIPVISTYGTGTRDAVNENYNGLLVPIKDSLRLKDAMEKLTLDNTLAKQLGENGISWSKNFKREVIWEGMEDLYKSFDEL